MKYMIKLILLFIIGFILNGCRSNITNGEIPQEYVSRVKPHLGDYQGYFGNKTHKAIFSLKLVGRKVVASLKVSGGSCKYFVGNLLDVEVRKSSIYSATFAISSDCLSGDKLTVVVSGSKLNLSAIESVLRSEDCPSQSEILSCQMDVTMNNARVSQENNNSGVDDSGLPCTRSQFPESWDTCRSQSSRDYSRCATCSTYSTNKVIYGSVSK